MMVLVQNSNINILFRNFKSTLNVPNTTFDYLSTIHWRAGGQRSDITTTTERKEMS